MNLLNLVKEYITPDVVRAASVSLGEGEKGISKAISGILPIIFSKLIQKSSSTDGANSVFSLVQQVSKTNFLNDLEKKNNSTNLFSKTNSNTAGTTTLLNSLFGDKLDKVTNALGNFAGIRQKSVLSLLEFMSPLSLAVLGKHVHANKLDASSLVSFLASQKETVTSAMPSDSHLKEVFDVLNLAQVKTPAKIESPKSATTAKVVTQDEDYTFMRWSLALLVLGGIIGTAIYLRRNNTPDFKSDLTQTEVKKNDDVSVIRTSAVAPSDAKIDFEKNTDKPVTEKNVTENLNKPVEKPIETKKEEVPTQMVAASASPSPSTPKESNKTDTEDYIYDIGSPIKLKLPNGVELEVGERSAEKKLFDMLNDPNFKVDDKDKTEGWFSLDRVYFEIGRASLKAESQAQLERITKILQAFPNAEIRVGGYTDNTGDFTSNRKLSAERAGIVLDKLVALGIAHNRLKSRGYGSKYPVCSSNDSPTCKARNRRVDLRVTKK